jgi:hypothetical protein
VGVTIVLMTEQSYGPTQQTAGLSGILPSMKDNGNLQSGNRQYASQARRASLGGNRTGKDSVHTPRESRLSRATPPSRGEPS